MFTSHARLKRKTPAQGINRREFIEHLVEEYHTTTNVEAQEQVTANLANFAYDPINWNFLKEAQALHLFVDLLSIPNERLQLHAAAGLCNICQDPQASKFITKPQNCTKLSQLLETTENVEIHLNLITLLYQLLQVIGHPEVKQLLLTPNNLKKISSLRQVENDPRLVNLATVFLEDFGTRFEVVEVPARPAAATNTGNVDTATDATLQPTRLQVEGNRFK